MAPIRGKQDRMTNLSLSLFCIALEGECAHKCVIDCKKIHINQKKIPLCRQKILQIKNNFKTYEKSEIQSPLGFVGLFRNCTNEYQLRKK